MKCHWCGSTDNVEGCVEDEPCCKECCACDDLRALFSKMKIERLKDGVEEGK